MQTVFLTSWPLLNLVLFGLALQSIARWAYDMKYSRQTRLFSQVIITVIVLLAVRQATLEQGSQFISRQPQPRRAITESIFRHGVLIDSPTYSLKSHLTISPENRTSTNRMGQDNAPTDLRTGAVTVRLVQSALHPLPGLRWEPKQTDVQLTRDGQAMYTIQGELVWSLLTIPVFRQEKTFTQRSTL